MEQNVVRDIVYARDMRMWYNYTDKVIISDEEVRKMLNEGKISLAQISSNPDVIPIFSSEDDMWSWVAKTMRINNIVKDILSKSSKWF